MLRMVAGFEMPSAGAILLDGQDDREGLGGVWVSARGLTDPSDMSDEHKFLRAMRPQLGLHASRSATPRGRE